MKLPKISNSQLTPELKDRLGNIDLEFDSLVDPSDVLEISSNLDAIREEVISIGQELIQSRKKQEEYGRESKKRDSEDGKAVD
tara:strand:+ start:135 stop:383 length:249 start_codon:yes stop_codon:yes gene_type:complete